MAEGNIFDTCEDVYSQARARTYCLWIRFEFMAAEKRTAAENEEEQTYVPGDNPHLHTRTCGEHRVTKITSLPEIDSTLSMATSIQV